jgi:hypothetical protein
MRQAIVAPHLGVWSSLPPLTDNPAARPKPPAQSIVARLAVLRAEAYARAAEQIRQRPDLWHWGSAA